MAFATIGTMRKMVKFNRNIDKSSQTRTVFFLRAQQAQRYRSFIDQNGIFSASCDESRQSLHTTQFRDSAHGFRSKTLLFLGIIKWETAGAGRFRR
jgi:hypothetical protein